MIILWEVQASHYEGLYAGLISLKTMRMASLSYEINMIKKGKMQETVHWLVH